LSGSANVLPSALGLQRHLANVGSGLSVELSLRCQASRLTAVPGAHATVVLPASDTELLPHSSSLEPSLPVPGGLTSGTDAAHTSGLRQTRTLLKLLRHLQVGSVELHLLLQGTEAREVIFRAGAVRHEGLGARDLVRTWRTINAGNFPRLKQLLGCTAENGLDLWAQPVRNV
jgi:hypothetical protein